MIPGGLYVMLTFFDRDDWPSLKAAVDKLYRYACRFDANPLPSFASELIDLEQPRTQIRGRLEALATEFMAFAAALG